MNFYVKIILFIIFISFVLPSSLNIRKCSIVNNEDRIRPNTQTNALSPTGDFLIHYDIAGQHAPSLDDINNNGIPDYIDEVGIIADSAKYVIVDIMGFLPLILDSDGIYDIYIHLYRCASQRSKL